ncbi:YwmB family TATA-box binding protein [Heyndrickxia coagulans]|uniref:YwmB family TATA-box binding protein n=1 Tax=Heyndrickxia coagulans TaxID=1398 RepID=A0AAW7CG90_HEYCO|nr:YwmB family TATA-box binding protein [Heyndrickxia coagulans]MDL5041718.1 YwmB family TATA-box binding protein [Heyndrickxia coagulans]MDT9757258.1 YwmB family TATA-box binding protein [Heyndrickxia coagulans]
MKFRFVYPVLAIVGLTLIFMGNKTDAANFTDQLQLFQASIAKLNGKVTEWSLYTREPLRAPSEPEWAEKVQTLQDTFPEMHWSVKKDRHVKVLTGKLEKSHYVETVKLMSTLSNAENGSYIIYEVNGKGWDRAQMRKVNQLVSARTRALFTKKPMVFSCIKGEFSDKMDHVLLRGKKEQLLKRLDAQEIETMEEKNFYAVSGYSPKFSENIHVKNRKMNVQIGLRDSGLGGKTTVVIGTPIITIEY